MADKKPEDTKSKPTEVKEEQNFDKGPVPDYNPAPRDQPASEREKPTR